MNKLDPKSLKRALSAYPSLREVYVDIRGDLEKVEDTLKDISKSSNRIITEISEYLFRRAGKRMRPALLMLSSRLFGYRGEEHVLLSALVETIHTASLIHDDIIDNSEIRRGQDTVHTRWGPNITVLLGDYLYIKTIGLSLQTSRREFIRILTDVSAQMIEGELHEYAMSGNLELVEEDYLNIIRKKTASLFSASCLLGALLGNAPVKDQQSIAEYGTALGMAFQIIDDLLDYAGDHKILGKPVLSDLAEGRITLPMIHTLNQNDESQRTRLTELFKRKDADPAVKQEILDIVRSNGALEYTRHQAESFSRKAQMFLEDLPDSMHRESLYLIPEYVLHRNI
jgi:octaprenyl-diphosphate synthase